MQVLANCMAPPPAVTFIAFNPMDNNIVAIGMEDTIIQQFKFSMLQTMRFCGFRIFFILSAILCCY